MLVQYEIGLSMKHGCYQAEWLSYVQTEATIPNVRQNVTGRLSCS